MTTPANGQADRLTFEVGADARPWPRSRGHYLTLIAVGLALGFAARWLDPPRPLPPEDGISRVNSGGTLLIPGHTHGDAPERLDCPGCYRYQCDLAQRQTLAVLQELERRRLAAVAPEGSARGAR